ncbi:MAG: pyridoxal-dependent decarboxylase [Alphaproteobacteria bacterium]
MTAPPAMDVEEFRRLGHKAVDLVSDYLAGVASRPVFTPMTPGERQSLLDEDWPRTGCPAEALIEAVAAKVLPHAMGNGHPRFFGWVNSPPAPIGVIGDFLASALNPSCAGGDHAAVYIERAAIRWLMELLGYPADGSMGLLVSGGSVANLIGLAAARHRASAEMGSNVRAEGLHGVRRRLLLYMTAEGHSCVRKAVELMGLGTDSIRTVPIDRDFRMDVPALEAAVARDRAAGLLPFAVVASAGTVSTGAIDPLARIADVAERERLWLHVDGAYGGVGITAPGRAERYKGLDRADSLALDPHKWLSVPIECGCAFVRDGALLRDAFSYVPAYLRTEEGKGFGGPTWFSEYGIQQTRGFRALKLWLVLQHMGRQGIAALVSRHIGLAERLAAAVDRAPDLERLAPAELSIVCFRFTPPGRALDGEGLDALNKRIMETIQSEGRAFLSNATLGGRFALRACILHYGTVEADVDALVDLVRETGTRLLNE